MSKTNPFINRNPLIILEPEEPNKGCPTCKGADFLARKVSGVVYFTCLNETCKTQWSGGLPRVPEDPKMPKPPMDPRDKPRVVFDWDPTMHKIVEIDYPVDLTQDFRKGAPIPGEDDEW